MGKSIRTPNFISVRSRIFLILLSFLTQPSLDAQSIVHGGFLSFTITDSLQSNGGGSILYSDTQSDCIKLQGGLVFGKSEIFDKAGIFGEMCIESHKITNLKLYPNPGIGEYFIEGNEITSINVTNCLGQKIKDLQYNAHESMRIILNLKEESEGTYFVKIYNLKNQEWIIPIIKMNQ